MWCPTSSLNRTELLLIRSNDLLMATITLTGSNRCGPCGNSDKPECHLDVGSSTACDECKKAKTSCPFSVQKHPGRKSGK